MVYLDNSASTYYKPLSVKWAVIKSLFTLTANPGRSGHKASLRCGEAVFDVRQTLASTFNTSADRVVFTSGCTEALNLALRGSAKKKGHIITTCFEHNSVLRTLEYMCAKEDIDYTVVTPSSENGIITTAELDKAKKSNTYMLVVNHISNVIGVKQNISALGKWAKENGILFVVDGAQSAGHESIDMKANNINMLALAGHKGLYGLQGVGALLIDDTTELKAIKFGGTGTYSESLIQPKDIPEGLESGTLPTPAIISLGAGCKYAYKNIDKHSFREQILTKFLLDELNKRDKIIVYTPDNTYSGVVAFNIKDKAASEMANELNEKGFAVRSGLQCAPLVHKYLGTLDTGGVVRASLGRKNTKTQIIKFLNAIDEIISNV